MTLLTQELFLAIVGVFVAVFLFVSGLSLNFLHNIDKKLTMIEPILSLVYKKQVIEEYKNKVQGAVNPDPPDDPLSEKDILLQKLDDNTITTEEAKRLKAILDREAQQARQAGNAGVLLVILALIAILIIIIASSEQ